MSFDPGLVNRPFLGVNRPITRNPNSDDDEDEDEDDGDDDDDDEDEDEDDDDDDEDDDDDGVVNARSTFWFLALGPEP